jgi:GTP-binding protein HflX
MISGNTEGIKNIILEELEKLFDIHTNRGEFASPELLQRMAELSGLIKRELSVYLSRGGRVKDVSVGSASHVALPYLRLKRGLEVLSGIRCIHTHPEGTGQLSEVDLGTLISTRLDAMAALGVKGESPDTLGVAYIADDLLKTLEYGPFPVHKLPQRALMAEIALADKRVKELVAMKETEGYEEKAILIGVNVSEQSMEELERLADTAGAVVLKKIIQKRPSVDMRYYIGKGMAQTISLEVSALNADLVIADDALSALTVKNLEEILGVKVVDRTALILDIFARRAQTREGRLQVELAQLKYALPRLRGDAPYLSRLGGGIGTRGPGEKKLEADRRRIKRRIFELERDLGEVSAQRDLRRETRRDTGIQVAALVGYTNAGKSTLLNALSGADVFAEDKLFATLDTVTRKIKLPSAREALLTDTVGFIEKLPHELVSAFKSTLEEVKYADVLVHVIDVSNEAHELQENIVEEVLASLGAGDKRVIKAYNKADQVETKFSNKNGVCFISAKTGEGLPELLHTLDEVLMPRMQAFALAVPYSRGDVQSFITKNVPDCVFDYTETGIGASGQAEDRIVKQIFRMMEQDVR